jgi:hypothetical protein
MLTQVFSDRGVMVRSFGHMAAVAAFGAVCTSVIACSGFSGEGCAASRTCTPKHGTGGDTSEGDAAPVSAAGSGGSTGNGGQVGAGGNGAPLAAAGSDGVGGAQSSGAPGAGGIGADPGGSADAASVDAGADDADDGSSRGTGRGADGGGSCRAGFVDCNGDPADGCEAELATDEEHCGACGTACSANGTSSNVCVQGKCTPACDTKHADCDKNGVNGCEADLAGAGNCGVCGRACSSANAATLACTAGACKPVCAANFGDCKTPVPPAADDGCETNLTLPTSCGACGHDCQGGACVGGQCQPVSLAQGVLYPYMIVADAKYVYWLDKGTQPDTTGRTLRRVSVAGGGTTLIGTDGRASPGMAVDGTNLYWGVYSVATDGEAANGLIYVTPEDGAKGWAIQPGTDPTSIAADGTNVYWADASSDQIFRAKRDGSEVARAVASGIKQVNALMVDSTTLFGISDGLTTLFSVPAAGGGVTRLTTDSAGGLTVASISIALDSTHVYAWLQDTNSVFHLEQLDKKTLAPTRELTRSSSVIGAYTPLAYANNYVYFVADDGVYRVSTTANAQPALVVKTTALALAMTVYGGTVYWAENGSSTPSALKKLAVF